MPRTRAIRQQARSHIAVSPPSSPVALNRDAAISAQSAVVTHHKSHSTSKIDPPVPRFPTLLPQDTLTVRRSPRLLDAPQLNKYSRISVAMSSGRRPLGGRLRADQVRHHLDESYSSSGNDDVEIERRITRSNGKKSRGRPRRNESPVATVVSEVPTASDDETDICSRSKKRRTSERSTVRRKSSTKKLSGKGKKGRKSKRKGKAKPEMGKGAKGKQPTGISLEISDEGMCEEGLHTVNDLSIADTIVCQDTPDYNLHPSPVIQSLSVVIPETDAETVSDTACSEVLPISSTSEHNPLDSSQLAATPSLNTPEQSVPDGDVSHQVDVAYVDTELEFEVTNSGIRSSSITPDFHTPSHTPSVDYSGFVTPPPPAPDANHGQLLMAPRAQRIQDFTTYRPNVEKSPSRQARRRRLFPAASTSSQSPATRPSALRFGSSFVSPPSAPPLNGFNDSSPAIPNSRVSDSPPFSSIRRRLVFDDDEEDEEETSTSQMSRVSAFSGPTISPSNPLLEASPLSRPRQTSATNDLVTTTPTRPSSFVPLVSPTNPSTIGLSLFNPPSSGYSNSRLNARSFALPSSQSTMSPRTSSTHRPSSSIQRADRTTESHPQTSVDTTTTQSPQTLQHVTRPIPRIPTFQSPSSTSIRPTPIFSPFTSIPSQSQSLFQSPPSTSTTQSSSMFSSIGRTFPPKPKPLVLQGGRVAPYSLKKDYKKDKDGNGRNGAGGNDIRSFR